ADLEVILADGLEVVHRVEARHLPRLRGMDAEVCPHFLEHLGREPASLALRGVERRQEERHLVGVARLQLLHFAIELLRKDLGHKFYRSSSPAMMLMLPRAATISAIFRPWVMGVSAWKCQTDGPRMRMRCARGLPLLTM